MNAVVLQKSCNMHLRETLRFAFILLIYMSQIVISEASDIIVSGARIGGDELRKVKTANKSAFCCHQVPTPSPKEQDRASAGWSKAFAMVLPMLNTHRSS
jgi:hypothetical protein